MTDATNYIVIYFTTGPATITPEAERFDNLADAESARSEFFANNGDAYAAEIHPIA